MCVVRALGMPVFATMDKLPEKSQGRGSYPTQMNSLQILSCITEEWVKLGEQSQNFPCIIALPRLASQKNAVALPWLATRGCKKGQVIVARKEARRPASLLNIDGQDLAINPILHPHPKYNVICHTDGTPGMTYGVSTAKGTKNESCNSCKKD